MGPGQTLIARSADLTRAKPPRWAWQHRVVIGYLNLLLGNEGIGKGTFAAWLIARLTRGELPGDLRDTPARIGVVGDEDSFDDVWTPRLHAAGADLDRVVQLERQDGDMIDVRADRSRLAEAVQGEHLSVLYFDQLLDNLSVGESAGNQQKPIRDALRPLRAIARDLDIATLCALHPNKRGSTFRELVAASVAYNAVSRSSLLLAEHPENPDRRVLARGKGNLSKTPPGVEFAIASHTFTANGHAFDVPTVANVEVGDLTVDDLIDRRGADDGADRDDVEAAIANALGDGQPHTPREIKAAVANELGCAWKTVQRAADRLASEGQLMREHPDQPSLTRWRSLDTPISGHVSKEQEGPETLGEALFGHVDTEEGVQSGDDLDAESARIVAKFPEQDAGAGR